MFPGKIKSPKPNAASSSATRPPGDGGDEVYADESESSKGKGQPKIEAMEGKGGRTLQRGLDSIFTQIGNNPLAVSSVVAVESDCDAEEGGDKVVVEFGALNIKDSKKEIDPSAPQKSDYIEEDLQRGRCSSSGSQQKGNNTKDEWGTSKTDDKLRPPVCRFLGHAGAGKSKLFDCLRGSHVKGAAAGGSTQETSTIYFHAENIEKRAKELKVDIELRVPGLLVIDTAGHDFFSNLKSSGSCCDVAILVLDIIYGLDQRTIDCLEHLISNVAKLIIVLNKVDRIYEWKRHTNVTFSRAYKSQTESVQTEFQSRLLEVTDQLWVHGFCSDMWFRFRGRRDAFCIVPTSAISGEGVPDLLRLLVKWANITMEEKLTQDEGKGHEQDVGEPHFYDPEFDLKKVPSTMRKYYERRVNKQQQTR